MDIHLFTDYVIVYRVGETKGNDVIYFKMVVGVIIATLLAGCAHTPFNAINAKSYEDGKDNEGNQAYSRVFAWDSKYTAGVGNSNGSCVQGALTAKSTSFAAALDIVAKEQIAKGAAAVGFAEAVMALNASSVQTTYGNLGYFYLCQIALNQSASNNPLTATEIASMWKNVGDTAKSITLTAVNLQTLSAPQLDNMRAYLEALGVDDADIPKDDTELQEAIDNAVNEQASETAG